MFGAEFTIIVDTQTGVNYLLTHDSDGAGITPPSRFGRKTRRNKNRRINHCAFNQSTHFSIGNAYFFYNFSLT